MDDKPLSEEFAQFLFSAGRQEDDLLVNSLKSAAGLSGGGLAEAVDEFLDGEGDLQTTTRAAVAKSGTSAIKELAALLANQFKLPAGVAELVAGLLVTLLPKTEKEAATKKKPRRAKPKTTASAKTSAEEKKKPKPKTAASAKKPRPKPKTAASAKKPSSKPKTTTKPKKKTSSE